MDHQHHHLHEHGDEPETVLHHKQEKNSSSSVLPIAILAGALLISGSIIYTAKELTKIYSPASIKLTGTNNTGTNQNQPSNQPQDTTNVKVSVDDDPVLGKSDAPLTLIEFSDYECPYCKRFFEQTLSEIKTDYINSGKIKFVYRDFPLPFHDPMATMEAQAASCAKEQGGDSTYFRFHDELFKRTKSNGNGLTQEQVYQIASDLGLNVQQIRSCVNTNKYKSEIEKDIQEGNDYGVSGTPTAFLGKTTPDGQIEAVKIVGAQPYAIFKAAIEQLLTK